MYFCLMIFFFLRAVWRTGGRVINGTFVWYNGPKSNAKPMAYTNWQKGHPAAYTSMALVYNRQKDRVRWQGVWLGSYKQLPDHAYAFICERRARSKICFTSCVGCVSTSKVPYSIYFLKNYSYFLCCYHI